MVLRLVIFYKLVERKISSFPLRIVLHLSVINAGLRPKISVTLTIHYSIQLDYFGTHSLTKQLQIGITYKTHQRIAPLWRASKNSKKLSHSRATCTRAALLFGSLYVQHDPALYTGPQPEGVGGQLRTMAARRNFYIVDEIFAPHHDKIPRLRAWYSYRYIYRYRCVPPKRLPLRREYIHTLI